MVMRIQIIFLLVCITCNYALATCNFGSDVNWIDPIDTVGHDMTYITCKNTSVSDYVHDILKLNHDEKASFTFIQLDIVDSNFSVLENLINPVAIINTYNLLDHWFGLKLSSCHVKIIVENAFENFKNMSHLDLSFNEIEDLTFVRYLPSSVENLYLQNNKITHINFEFFNKPIFSLDLSFNRLKEINFSFKSDTGNQGYLFPIILLNLSNNNITTIDVNPTFDGWSNLAINMANNPLQHIKNCELKLNESLESGINLLNLTNSLAHLPIKSITKCKLKFRSLILSNNNVTLDCNLALNLDHADYSNTAITHIPKGIFEGRTFATLNLSHNNLESLSDPVFNQSKFHNTLDLSHSKIRNIDNVFHGMTAYDINLSSNNITELNSSSFSKIVSGRRINLSFNNMKLNNKSFVNCRDLIALNLANSNISVIEEESFYGLNRLLILQLENNSLKRLKTKVFKPLMHISLINLQNNQLTVLQSELFKFIPLRHLELSDNRIELIETRAFYNLNNLFHIKINNNNAILKIEKHAFSDLHSLGSINLSASGLTSANGDIVSITPRLQLMDLRNNNITSIDFSKRNGLGALEQLHLTLIGDLTPKSFLGMPFLKNLTFWDSKIRILHSRAFQGLFNLKSLELKSSEITTIENGAFDGLFRLEHFDLENVFRNKKNLSEMSFEDLHNIQNLNLSNQELHSIAPNTLKGLNKLRNLYLNNNRLNSFASSTFAGLQSLSLLNLSYNSISVLKRDNFKYLDSLTTLDLSNNNLKDIELGAFQHFPRMAELVLRRNNLSEFKVGAFSNLYSLTTLDLAQNNISTLSFESFLPLHSLSSLNLEFNNIRTFANYSLVLNLNSMKWIGVAKNKWPCEYLEQMLATLRNIGITYSTSSVNFYDNNIEGIDCVDVCKFLQCLQDSHGIN